MWSGDGVNRIPQTWAGELKPGTIDANSSRRFAYRDRNGVEKYMRLMLKKHRTGEVIIAYARAWGPKGVLEGSLGIPLKRDEYSRAVPIGDGVYRAGPNTIRIHPELSTKRGVVFDVIDGPDKPLSLSVFASDPHILALRHLRKGRADELSRSKNR